MMLYLDTYCSLLHLCCNFCTNECMSLLSHSNVVDTSYLFQTDGAPHLAPSLRDVCRFLFNVSLDETHDSSEDARASLQAAVHVLHHGLTQPVPVLSAYRPPLPQEFHPMMSLRDDVKAAMGYSSAMSYDNDDMNLHFDDLVASLNLES
jgi:hypothetical protein